MPSLTPSEIAREALKQLMARRLPPTPDNYQALYDEIGGARSPTPFPQAQLRTILRVLPGQTPVQQRLLKQYEHAVAAKDWSGLQAVLVGYANLGLNPAHTVSALSAASAPVQPVASVPPALADALQRLLGHLMAAFADDARLADIAGQLHDTLGQPDLPVAVLSQSLNQFSHRLSFSAEDQAAIHRTLLALLRATFENVAVLSSDDQAMQGQAQALMAAAEPPLTLRRLDAVQQSLKEVIYRQTEAHARSTQARKLLKDMLSAFLSRLSQITSSSAQHQATLERCAERLQHVTDLQDMAPVIEDLMSTTRAMALDSRVAHEELHTLREQAEHAHAQVERLQQELRQASAQARHDPLTGSLNRKGLDEAMEREIARARRNDEPLCVALLDLDNFKQINDRLGHTTGDEALMHLADVAREVLRPQDLLARYGGEEFVIVLPQVATPQGVEIMTRLQRELTTRLFLANEEKLLITFSAGVTQVSPSDTSFDAISRADRGMYLAKRAGKNRVMPV